MIYHIYNGGMNPVKKISRQMRENLARATGAETGGFYFQVGQKHYWSDHREPTMLIFKDVKRPASPPPKPYFVGSYSTFQHVEKLRDIGFSIMFVAESQKKAMIQFLEHINSAIEYMELEREPITENDLELNKNGDGVMEWVYDSEELGAVYTLHIYLDRYLTVV